MSVPENLMIVSALFSCSPSGLSILARSSQLACLASSGEGYCLKNSHRIGQAAVPVRKHINVKINYTRALSQIYVKSPLYCK